MTVHLVTCVIVFLSICCFASVVSAQAAAGSDDLPCEYARSYEYAAGLADPEIEVRLIFCPKQLLPFRACPCSVCTSYHGCFHS